MCVRLPALPKSWVKKRIMNSATRGSIGVVALQSRYMGKDVFVSDLTNVWLIGTFYQTSQGAGTVGAKDTSFGYVFPAIRGIQARREYYVSMCPLRLIPKLFLFDEV